MAEDIPTHTTANIAVSAEFFDYLLAELERPPKVNPKMVELLRKTRGTIRHG